MKKFALVFLVISLINSVDGQVIPFPESAVYNEISPWGHTDLGTNWDTSPFLPFIYQGAQFRFMPPNDVSYDNETDSWDFSGTEKYPIICFFNGRGEDGTDNNKHLKHGGRQHRDAVLSEEFNGFLLYPQGATHPEMYNILMKLVADGLPIDLNRVYVHGLSKGAGGTWLFALDYPHVVSAIWPMSGATNGSDAQYTNLIYSPIRLAQGGLDDNPSPGYAEGEVNQILGLGGQVEYFLYPNNGHNTWNVSYNRSDFFTWFLEQAHNRVYAKYQYNEICPEDPIQTTLGVTPGHDNYEWRKDGVVLPGVNVHEINVTEFGVYDARVMINGEWTDFGTPLEVFEKPPTQTPPISTRTFVSTYLPDANGATTVSLKLPNTYEFYEWYDGAENLIGSDSLLLDVGVGEYNALVQEFGGCSSNFSDPFKVIAADGPNQPDTLLAVFADELSKTEIQLNWSQKNSPEINETGFEIFRRTEGENYTLIALVNTDEFQYNDSNLLANTMYEYLVRPIGMESAAPFSSIASATTLRDEIPPTPPTNLIKTTSSSSAIGLSWNPSTDDVGVDKYLVYKDDELVLTTLNTSTVVYSLKENQIYSFTVAAQDESGNISALSNRVVAAAVANGLSYKYYKGTWDVLPDFNSLTPAYSGQSPNVDISVRDQNDNFGFLWEGVIQIPVAGNYTFETYSDDGSKLYIGGYNEANLVVNNDGLHGARFREGTYNFPSAGSYAIAMTFFEKGGGERMEVYWKNTAHGVTNRERIPDSAFAGEDVIPDETVTMPSNLTATAVSFDQIDLTWSDNSDNEVGFQIYRAEGENGELAPIAIVNANVTTYEDSGNLSPGTTYTYGIVALGQYSESVMEGGVVSNDDLLLQMPLDGDVSDVSGNGVSSNERNGPTYSTTDFYEGTAAMQFPGNSYIDVDVSNQFIHTRFTERTITMWLKASDLTGIQDFFDEGGSTNGIGLRINNGSVELGVQDNHEIHIASGPITADTWHHIAGVYDAGTLTLYIDGSLADQVIDIAYAGLEVSDHGDAGGLGSTNGSNAFDQANNNFDGLLDDVRVYSSAFNISSVLSLINGDANQATTFALPTPPNAPVITSVVSTEPTENTVSWTSSNQDAFEIFRSETENGGFILIAEVVDNSDGSFNYDDLTVLAHTTYYYKVQAYNAGGISGFSDVSSVTTLNNTPVLLESVNDIFMHYESTRDLTFTVTDGDGDDVSFSSNNLPSFAVLMDNGDNTASLSIDPDITNNNTTYSGIELIIDDGFGGVVTETFAITVNDNYSPEVASFIPVSATAGEVSSLTLTATDQNGDPMSWAVLSTLPSFITHGTTTGSSFELTVSPVDVNDVGDYTVELSVEDDQVPAGITYVTVPVTVAPASLVEEMRVNFTGGPAGSNPWNNMTTLIPSSGMVLSDLINNSGSSTGISLALETDWGGVGNYGGMPTGHYEENVRLSYFWSDNGAETMRLSGLDVNKTYGFDFYASRNAYGSRTTTFTVGGVSQSIQAAKNADVLVHFDPISPDGSGEIEITVDHPAGNVAYLNAMVITSESQSVPISPSDLSVDIVTGNVELNWTDNSNNESGFEIHASEVDNTSYALVETVTGSSYTYVPTSQSNVYFKVRAVNGIGTSGYSNEVFFEYVNLTPQLSPIADAEMSYGETLVIDVSFSDPEDDVVTIEVAGADSFSSYQNTGPGTGEITLTPTQDEVGTHIITLTARDTEENESSVIFELTVLNPTLETVLLNFTSNTSTVAAPWNNLVGAPTAGHSLSDLTTTESSNSGITVTLLDSWYGAWDFGATTGDDSGVYPDAAMISYYADNSGAIMRIEFSGLNLAKVYDFTMFASRGNIQDTRITTYEIGASTATLNVTNNTSEVAKINGVEPDGTGSIVLEVSKGAYPWKYINAIEISYYDAPLTPGKPSDLAASPLSRSDISLSWADNSSNEDGFEIERGVDGGTWTQIATVGSNVTSYTDTGLTENTTYSYRVRAYNTNGTSSYSEVVEETTYDYYIYLNIGGPDFIASSPWNNMAQEPFEGVTSSSLKDDLGQQTSIQMEITDNNELTTFSAAGSLGMNTGDNSGAVPDVVMQSYYWLNQLDLGTFKFTNLLLNQEYTVEFFASRSANNRTTVYTIGSESVTLNSSFNTTETVEITNVRPDENGEIHVDVRSLSGQHLGYINAVILKASDATEPNTISEGGGSRVTDNATAAASMEEEDVIESTELIVYPNPFVDRINVKVVAANDRNVSLTLYNTSGMIYYQVGTHLSKGINTIILPSNELKSGIYFVRLSDESGDQVFQVIKR